MDSNATKDALLIFDFDNTLIDKNTDAEIINAQKLLGQCLSGKRYHFDIYKCYCVICVLAFKLIIIQR